MPSHFQKLLGKHEILNKGKQSAFVLFNMGIDGFTPLIGDLQFYPSSHLG